MGHDPEVLGKEPLPEDDRCGGCRTPQPRFLAPSHQGVLSSGPFHDSRRPSRGNDSFQDPDALLCDPGPQRRPPSAMGHSFIARPAHRDPYLLPCIIARTMPFSLPRHVSARCALMYPDYPVCRQSVYHIHQQSMWLLFFASQVPFPSTSDGCCFTILFVIYFPTRLPV